MLLTALFSGILEEKEVKTTLDLKLIVSLIRQRAIFVVDLWEQGRFFFEQPTSYDPKAVKKVFKEDTASILVKVSEILNQQTIFDSETISKEIKDWLSFNKMGVGKAMMPLRLALVGAMQGPDVFEIAGVLGKNQTISRIQNAISFINNRS